MLKKLKDKRGSIAIMEVIHILIAVIIFAMLADLVVISWQYVGITRATNELARTVGIQSGVERSTPTNYPGGPTAYYTSSELVDYFEDKADDLGFKSTTIEINDRRLSGSVSIMSDYRQDIEVRTVSEYEWKFLGNFIPFLRDGRTIVVNKIVFGSINEPKED